MPRHSEPHDPSDCSCAVCCDRHDEAIMIAQERERLQAFADVAALYSAGMLGALRLPYADDGEEELDASPF